MPSEQNKEWAVEFLGRYRVALSELLEAGNLKDYDRHWEQRYYAALEEASKLNPVAWKIVQDVLQKVQEYDHDLQYSGQVSSQIVDIDRALGVLELGEELDENWPVDVAPKLDTSELHPWVWEPAKELWGIGRYREALHAAALTVNANLQAKLGREDDMEFAQLARNAFKLDDPTPTDPRLRFDLDAEWSEDAVKDFHFGAATLGEAVFRLWRNIPSHRTYRVEEQTATEALGALSTFARMIDDAIVVVDD